MSNFFSKLLHFTDNRTKKTKDKIRESIRDKKLLLSNEQKKNAADLVFGKIESTQAFKEANAILVYWSTPSELPTHDFVRKWSKEKTILLPSVHQDTILLKKFINSGKSAGSNGKVDPNTEHYNGTFELAVLPGVAFDKRKNRMGRGRGIYRKYLDHKNVQTYGVGYDFQLLDRLPDSGDNFTLEKIFTPNMVVG